MLQCNDLVKSYRKKNAVNHLSLNLEAGKIYALLGPNGSGKTTLMKMIAGLVKPTAGSILFEGKPVDTASKARIAYMPTEAFFYSYMTGRDAGKYYRDFSKISHGAVRPVPGGDGTGSFSENFQNVLRHDGQAEDRSDPLPGRRLIMLDEPLNGIDLITREKIVEAVTNSFSPGKTFVLSKPSGRGTGKNHPSRLLYPKRGTGAGKEAWTICTANREKPL